MPSRKMTRDTSDKREWFQTKPMKQQVSKPSPLSRSLPLEYMSIKTNFIDMFSQHVVTIDISA